MWINSQIFGVLPSLKQTLHSSRAAARIFECLKGVKWKIEHPLQSWNRSSKSSHASVCCDNTQANVVLILDPLQLLLMLDKILALSPPSQQPPVGSQCVTYHHSLLYCVWATGPHVPILYVLIRYMFMYFSPDGNMKSWRESAESVTTAKLERFILVINYRRCI